MSHQSIIAIVIATINDDLNTYTDLLETLEQQQQQLIARESHTLGDTARIITSLLETARSNRQKRSGALSDMGLDNTPEGMEEFIEGLQGKLFEDTSAEWDELLNLVEECKQINLINGRTLKLQQKVTEKLLSQMQINTEERHSYSSKGKSINQATSTLQVQA
ncbi:MAG: flagellar export chaperone FlgN [Endozoicomonas sp.]